jgi:tetratricopeptide (TPR) repeat protein
MILFSPRMGQDGHGYGLFTRSKRRERREFFTANHANGISRQNAQTGAHNSNILQPQIGADSRGLLYTTLGMRDPADKVIRIALALAPHDRFVLRCASRFLIHIGQTEKAHSILKRSETTPLDPWLLAAELAVASILEKSSRFTKVAEQMLVGSNLSPRHVSELAGALASTEMWAGNHRRARKLFSRSLEDPTENALAQGVWASRDVSVERVDQMLQARPNANEALTLSTYWAEQWSNSVELSRKWAQDEPFSTRPFLHGSFLASSALQNPAEGERIARLGLRVNPHDPGLLNNLAFSIVCLGRPIEAKEVISGISIEHGPEQSKICLLATRGLIEYRLERPSEGKKLYQEAISKASKLSLAPLKARALLYFAREEALADQPDFGSLLDDAIREVSRVRNPGLRQLVTAITTAIQQHRVRGNMKSGFNSGQSEKTTRMPSSGAGTADQQKSD